MFHQSMRATEVNPVLNEKHQSSLSQRKHGLACTLKFQPGSRKCIRVATLGRDQHFFSTMESATTICDWATSPRHEMNGLFGRRKSHRREPSHRRFCSLAWWKSRKAREKTTTSLTGDQNSGGPADQIAPSSTHAFTRCPDVCEPRNWIVWVVHIRILHWTG